MVNAAGCGSAMKDYGHLLRDDPAWAERAAAFAARVRDVTELLRRAEPRAERQPLPLKVAYHDACHLAHAQGVREQPRELLRSIPGLELVEPDEWEICCGSAGIYNLVKPEPAAELGAAQGAQPAGHRRRAWSRPRTRAARCRSRRMHPASRSSTRSSCVARSLAPAR